MPAALKGAAQSSDLKKKFAGKRAIYGEANRIELIAWDIATHFNENIKQLDIGLKGQIATDSKVDAIRYKRALDETGLVTSTVVISAPDTDFVFRCASLGSRVAVYDRLCRTFKLA